jgi:CRISPR-associated protein Csb2
MMRHLCISVTFLDPLFHGKGDDEPEWPPSPLRLFQALLAGARTGCRNLEWSDVKFEAFRWLEGRQPPLIIAPIVRRESAYTLYVPNNDGDRLFDRQNRLTSKIAHPHRLLDGHTLCYLWSISETEWLSNKTKVELLCCEARHLPVLGWGIDQVVGEGRILSDAEVVALPGERWWVSNGHRPEQPTWRVPVNGSLEDLQAVHESFLKRVQGRRFRPSRKPSCFQTVTYLTDRVLPVRPYAVFALPEGVSFRQVAAAKVAAMLRSLTCKLANESMHEFPGGSERYVAGHIDGDGQNPPRFSYMPLPTIGHPNADGIIRRLLIAEPIGGNGEHARWIQKRLGFATLRDKDGDERGILSEPRGSGSRKVIGRYVGKGQAWCSVTPVILPGHDDFKAAAKHGERRPMKAERLLLKSVTQAGIPLQSVASVSLRKAPFWSGSQHPRQYARPDYLADQNARPSWHVRIDFREPVTGPIAIGAGRHIGLGLFGVIDSQE